MRRSTILLLLLSLTVAGVSISGVSRALQANATSLVTFQGVLQTSKGEPISGAGVALFSGTLSSSVVTSSTGAFSLSVPTGDYRLQVNGAAASPPSIPFGWSADVPAITISGDLTQDLTLPVDTVTVQVRDSSNNPVPDTAIDLAGNTCDSAASSALWPGGPTTDSYSACPGGSAVTDSTGNVTFDYPANSTGITFTATPPGVFPSSSTVDVSTDPTIVVMQFAYYAVLSSAGTVSGQVGVEAPATMTLLGASDVAVSSGSVPNGAAAPVGAVTYQVHGVPVGGSIDVVLQLPSGSNPTNVYKFQNNVWVDVSSLATMSGNTVTLHLTDGGLGDADGLANGVIVDPVVPVRAVVPAAPTNVMAVPGNGQATVSWSAPSKNGGKPIDAYRVTPYLGGVSQTSVTFASTATSQVITGLSNTKSYTFRVQAHNQIGWGPLSVASAPVTVGAPTAPTAVSAVPGNSAATVHWMTPASTNGSAISRYVVTPYVGGVAQATHTFTSTTGTITGLSNGTTYAFEVAATNGNGTGPQSVASLPIVAGAPVAPTAVEAISGSTTTSTGPLNVSFTPGANNGSTITSYTATCKSANGGVNGTHTGAARPIIVTGLTTAKTYTCTVAATNARGTSRPSNVSLPVIVGSPATPTGVIVVNGTSGHLRVSFTAGANNGSTVTGFTATCSSFNGGVAGSRGGRAQRPHPNRGKAANTYTSNLTNARGAGLASAPSATIVAGISVIKHVIVITQENRPFDHYFGTFPGADGIPAGTCVPDPASGTCVKPFHSNADKTSDAPHGAANATADINGGKMDGFIAQAEEAGSVKPRDVMSYKDQREIPNYWAYAKNFVLEDHLYEPNASWSLPAHLYMVSGWSAICTSTTDPSTCKSSKSPTRNTPGYPWTDLTYLLHKNHVSWGYFVTTGHEPDCVDDSSLTCVPGSQDSATPSIWNPLPSFETVKNNGQTGNVQSVENFYTRAKNGTPSRGELGRAVRRGQRAPQPIDQRRPDLRDEPDQRRLEWPGLELHGHLLELGRLGRLLRPRRPADRGCKRLRPAGPRHHHQPIRQSRGRRSPVGVVRRHQPIHRGRLPQRSAHRPGHRRPARPRPDVRESLTAAGDLTTDFNFTQTPRPPLILPIHPTTDLK